MCLLPGFFWLNFRNSGGSVRRELGGGSRKTSLHVHTEDFPVLAFLYFYYYYYYYCNRIVGRRAGTCALPHRSLTGDLRWRWRCLWYRQDKEGPPCSRWLPPWLPSAPLNPKGLWWVECVSALKGVEHTIVYFFLLYIVQQGCASIEEVLKNPATTVKIAANALGQLEHGHKSIALLCSVHLVQVPQYLA